MKKKEREGSERIFNYLNNVFNFGCECGEFCPQEDKYCQTCEEKNPFFDKQVFYNENDIDIDEYTEKECKKGHSAIEIFCKDFPDLFSKNRQGFCPSCGQVVKVLD